MSTAETWTVGKLLTWTTEYLKKSGSQSPRLDAEVLLAHARECQRIELYTAFAEEPTEQARTAFREMVRRRAEGTPVAYLVGHKEFYSASFEVNPDVLIPRPETEHLVVEALDCAKRLREERGDASCQLRIADIGTGSGVIAVTMAKQLKHCLLTAIDVSPAALEIARRNAAKHGLTEESIAFLESNLLTACPLDQPFDMILSNPPYVSDAEYQQLDRSVREFEPKQALVAGPQGIEIIAEILVQARSRLVDDGYLIFEFSPMLAEKLPGAVGDAWQAPIVSKDFAGHARIVTLRPAA